MANVGPFIFGAVFFIVAILIAYLTFTLFERPARNHLRRALAKHEPVIDVNVSATRAIGE